MRYLLTHLVDETAQRLADHEAIRCRDESLTYGELSRRSNQLAHTLVERGVRRGDRVGLLMNKTVDCAVTIHGIMKAGAAYVPLDPGAPTARLAFVVRDCGIRHMVSESRKRNALKALGQEGIVFDSVIGLPADEEPASPCVSWAAVANASPEAPPDTGTMEQDLCYILYTSGSTGVPKGIMHTHRSALAWAEVSAAAYELTWQDRISNYAPLHFDLSTLDYFAGALAGATTVMIPEEHTRLPASLSALLETERLTLFYTVPFALIQLVTSGTVPSRDLSALRWILFGGEPIPTKHLRELMRLLPHVRFVNVYGPTEVNGCTHFPIPAIADDSDSPVSIGRPYPNVEALIVDSENQPVPPGDPGELLIRAPTMMAGYWGREDLNDRAFYVRERFTGFEERFHRTGDLVQTESDGTIRFLGRKDRQLKVRGCRVDLDEVEAALVTHESIDEAAVFAVRDAVGMVELQAAALPGDGSTATVADLKKHLRGRLPPYAVPGRLDVVNRFPRTSTGKIDRRALEAELATLAT